MKRCETAVRHPARSHPSTPLVALRTGAVLCIAGLLATGIIGGLLRAGVSVPGLGETAWPSRAVLAHAFLMISGFMGTVIGIERAIAVKARPAFAAPAASGLAGLLMLAGAAFAAARVAVLAAIAFIAVNLYVFSRQRAAHTALLLAGAAAWLVGNLLHALGSRPGAVIPWWFHRFDGCSRSHGHPPPPTPPALSPPSLRRLALCLLIGYAWLGISGLAWMATALGHPVRDVALHALGIGFIFSMMLGHAPVILPALARVKVAFSWFFHVPLALLHISLGARLFHGPFDSSMLRLGAAGNAAAIVLFVMTMAGSALAWRLKHEGSTKARHAVTTRH